MKPVKFIVIDAHGQHVIKNEDPVTINLYENELICAKCTSNTCMYTSTNTDYQISNAINAYFMSKDSKTFYNTMKANSESGNEWCFFTKHFSDLELNPDIAGNFKAQISEYQPNGKICKTTLINTTTLSNIITSYSDLSFNNVFIVYACRVNSTGQETFGLATEFSEGSSQEEEYGIGAELKILNKDKVEYEMVETFFNTQDGGAKYTATNERIKLGNRINVVVYKIQGSNKKYIRINKKYVWLKEYKKSHK